MQTASDQTVSDRGDANRSPGFRRVFAPGRVTLGPRAEADKPLAHSLSVDLTARADEQPSPIPLGFRSGRKFLLRFLEALRDAGIHHVILGFNHSKRDAGELLEEIGGEILPALEAEQPRRSARKKAHA